MAVSFVPEIREGCLQCCNTIPLAIIPRLFLALAISGCLASADLPLGDTLRRHELVVKYSTGYGMYV